MEFIIAPPQKPPNLQLIMGDRVEDGVPHILWSIVARKTPINRIKWWLFCKFFPFTIKQWDKEV